jgi:hypothetical protein
MLELLSSTAIFSVLLTYIVKSGKSLIGDREKKEKREVLEKDKQLLFLFK